MDKEISNKETLFQAEVAAESIGWKPLGNDAYLHVGNLDENVITVVGIANAEMAGLNVLWFVG